MEPEGHRVETRNSRLHYFNERIVYVHGFDESERFACVLVNEDAGLWEVWAIYSEPANEVDRTSVKPVAPQAYHVHYRGCVQGGGADRIQTAVQLMLYRDSKNKGGN